MNLSINQNALTLGLPASATLAHARIEVTDRDEFLTLRDRFAPEADLAPRIGDHPELSYSRYGIHFFITGPKEAAIVPATLREVHAA